MQMNHQRKSLEHENVSHYISLMKRLGIIFVCLLCVSGCLSKAPQTHDGRLIHISVVFDRGKNEKMSARDLRYHDEVGSYMENHLISCLSAVGYNTSLVKSIDNYTPQKDHYLLYVRIEKYHPGSSAARWLPTGAGVCELSIFYTIFDQNSKKVMARRDRERSHNAWELAPINLNQRMVENISTKLSSTYY